MAGVFNGVAPSTAAAGDEFVGDTADPTGVAVVITGDAVPAPGVTVAMPGVAVATAGDATPGVAMATPGVADATPGVAMATPGVATAIPGVATAIPVEAEIAVTGEEFTTSSWGVAVPGRSGAAGLGANAAVGVGRPGVIVGAPGVVAAPGVANGEPAGGEPIRGSPVRGLAGFGEPIRGPPVRGLAGFGVIGVLFLLFGVMVACLELPPGVVVAC
eukprot:sb/3470005/